MGTVENAIEVLQKLHKYSHKLEDENTILLEVVKAAIAWSNTNRDSKSISMDDPILVADNLEQAIANLKTVSSVDLLKKLVKE